VKDEFLATLSHEIRTPLNAVLGWTRILLSRENDPSTTRRAIEVIDRNASAQLTLVTDMLDMARITAGKARLDLSDIDVGTTLRTAVDVVRPAAEAKSIVVTVDLAADAPWVRGDADRLLQVFWNLLSNAVKFTEPGGTLYVRQTHTPRHVSISVTDSGIGITPDFLPHIFERFKQADPSAARRHGGLGLGLALVREIVHLHGGTVDVSSPGRNQGTTFTVTLPAIAGAVTTAAAPRDESRMSPLSGIHILVVEDDADAREIVTTAVTDAGASVTAVASVDEALGVLRSDAPEHADVVVADIGLPGADGYTLLSEIRRMPSDHGGTLPVIAVTAYATSQDRQTALDAGFYAHLPKPFVPDHLIATIARAAATTA